MPKTCTSVRSNLATSSLERPVGASYRRSPLAGEERHRVETRSLLLLAGHMVGAVSAASTHANALLTMQRRDGLWPPFPGADVGSAYETAIAAYALLTAGNSINPALRAVNALLQQEPLEASALWRWRFRMTDTKVAFDAAQYGWSWVPGTVSWAIPTAMSLLAVRRAMSAGLKLRPSAAERRRLAENMLLDRRCRSGGWNAGNAVVFGIPLTPHIDATAIALIALANSGHGSDVQSGLDWLSSRLPCSSAYSQAWAMIAADVHRTRIADPKHQEHLSPTHLKRLLSASSSAHNPATLAIAAIALAIHDHPNPFKVEPM